jgi:hypothetical protein
VGAGLAPKVVYLFIYFICICLVSVARNCHFWYNECIAHINVKSFSMASFRSIELQKHHSLYFMI